MKKTANSAPLNELQTKLKQKFPELTDTDLQLPTSKNDMIQMIGYKLRKTKNEMLHIINLL